MAFTNYSFERRKRDLEKKQKQEAKRKRKLEKKQAAQASREAASPPPSV